MSVLLNNTCVIGPRAAGFRRPSASIVNGVFGRHKQRERKTSLPHCSLSFLWLWAMLIFWAEDDISFKLMCVISGQSSCLIIVLTVPYLASDMVLLIMQCSRACGPDITRRSRLFSRIHTQRQGSSGLACGTVCDCCFRGLGFITERGRDREALSTSLTL